MAVGLKGTGGCPIHSKNRNIFRKIPSLDDVTLSFKDGMLQQISVEEIIGILRNNWKEDSILYGLRLHALICSVGLQGIPLLGNCLVEMFVNAGSIENARHVFNRLTPCNELLWTSLINGCIKKGNPLDILQLYEKLFCDHTIQPDAQTFIALLKACAKLKDVYRGRILHADVARRGLSERDHFVSSSLVDMYAKCGLIMKAQEVFDQLVFQNVVSWTTLIGGYLEVGDGEKALNLLEHMQGQGISPDAATFICCLKVSVVMGAVEKGQELHGEIERLGLLGKVSSIGNTVIDMYTKFGMLFLAREVFEELPVKDVVSWTVLIAGYVEHSKEKTAFELFESMQSLGISANAVTYGCLFRACGNSQFISKGEELHATLDKQGVSFASNPYIGCILVDMYLKFGFLSKAGQVFDRLPSRTVVAWNSFISGHIEHGQYEEALNCLELMKQEGVFMNEVSCIESLRACRKLKLLSQGAQIHLVIETLGLFQHDKVVGAALVDMYARCGSLSTARQVFDRLTVREAVAWTSLISGYAEFGHCDGAINCIEEMQHEGVRVDTATLVCSLKSFAIFGAMDKVQVIHCEIERQGICKGDAMVGNALFSIYAEAGRLDIAHELLLNFSHWDAVTWASLMTSYADQGHDTEVLACFDELQSQGLCPSVIMYLCGLKACGTMGIRESGYALHTEIEKRGLLENDLVLGNCLVNMYAKCGLVSSAKQIFNKLSFRSVVSWATLIAGYVQLDDFEEAIDCYERMQTDGVSPDGFTCVSCLKACCALGALAKGVYTHIDAERMGLMDSEPMIGTAVVDMYGKCGHLSNACEVFNRLSVHDLASWTALMGGYVWNGLGGYVFRFLEQMMREGLKPDSATLVIVLSACSKIGFYEKSEALFESMSSDHGVAPVYEHCICMVGNLVCAGNMNKATALIEKMPMAWHAEAWHMVLRACMPFQNLDLGKQAFENIVDQMLVPL